MARRWFSIVALLASGACGGRTDLGDPEGVASAPGCDEPSRCGGDLFGRWRAVSTCTDLGFVAAVLPCDGIEVRAEEPLISGYKSYSRDGLYSSKLGYSGSVRFFVPETCTDLRVMSCAVLEGLVRRRGELLLSEVSCVASRGGCTCDASLLPFEREASGAFSARGGRLIEESGDEGDYCVDGQALRLSHDSGDQLVFSRD